MIPSPRPSSELHTSEEEPDPYLAYLPDLRRCKRNRRAEQERARLNAIQTKRDQWKAASARYYANHPKVREKKRLRNAETRAAKKLARRRWDPPKKAKPTLEDQQLGDFDGNISLDLSADDEGGIHRFTLTDDDLLELFLQSLRHGSADACSDDCTEPTYSPPDTQETVAAEALLVLRAQGESNPDVCRQALLAEQPRDLHDAPLDSHEDRMAAWALLVPNYDSSDDESFPS
ncbi:hypothetical protein B0H10DRAFT_2063510 [Mycena sp. CBHHK59/15]|nr:hypothetical protein B0H10DRAFT_2063510 [Mycena sp. CBHHK59/15]